MAKILKFRRCAIFSAVLLALASRLEAAQTSVEVQGLKSGQQIELDINNNAVMGVSADKIYTLPSAATLSNLTAVTFSPNLSCPVGPDSDGKASILVQCGTIVPHVAVQNVNGGENGAGSSSPALDNGNADNSSAAAGGNGDDESLSLPNSVAASAGAGKSSAPTLNDASSDNNTNLTLPSSAQAGGSSGQNSAQNTQQNGQTKQNPNTEPPPWSCYTVDNPAATQNGWATEITGINMIRDIVGNFGPSLSRRQAFFAEGKDFPNWTKQQEFKPINLASVPNSPVKVPPQSTVVMGVNNQWHYTVGIYIDAAGLKHGWAYDMKNNVVTDYGSMLLTSVAGTLINPGHGVKGGGGTLVGDDLAVGYDSGTGQAYYWDLTQGTSYQIPLSGMDEAKTVRMGPAQVPTKYADDPADYQMAITWNSPTDGVWYYDHNGANPPPPTNLGQYQGSLIAAQTEAHAANWQHDIVGTFVDTNTVTHGFVLFSPEGKNHSSWAWEQFDRNPSGLSSGVTVVDTHLLSITDNYCLSGYYVDSDNKTHGFVAGLNIKKNKCIPQ